ncbi:unnamed protein product [Rotaria sordida]|uniref:NAD(P)(+)--arginine ADP-ribosyltransferase n=1 Tax=Rotaria sordida TaxID=392033 RepID=A0A814BGJ4_9BILA|nr:unnamed protein product [Rotaria sordida]
MTSFLSTSMDKEIACAFAETFDNENDDDEATIFTIWVDKNTAPKAIFAYLYHADCEPDDQEILFSLRTLFRIDKVKYVDYEETWYINMTVVDESNEEVQKVTAPWKTSILKENNSLPSVNESLIYVRDLSTDNGAFLSFQLSLDIVLRLDRNDFARQEMLSMCRTKFSHDSFTLAKIDRFEMTYKFEQDAVKWYTADSFLYRLLNEVLRTETVDSIFKLRYFIQDLHNQLAFMQVDYLKRLQRYDSPILKLYRGQVMTWNDLENKFRANIGNLISMNSFLSTTTDRYVARIFAGDSNIQNPETYVSVLYEIKIDTRLPHSVPFAELGDQSDFEHENEVLFSMGAVFRIGEICQEHRHLWIVKLTLTTDEDEQWNVLTEHLQQEEEIPNQMSTQDGTYIAGCLVGISEEDNAVLNVIRSGVIEGHAIFTLPDVSSEYPHGAVIEASGKEFRNAINLAIMKVQAQGIDFDLAAKYHENIVDVRTCKIDNTDEFPIPNRAEATGLLKTVLEKSIVLVGSSGNLNSTESDEGDEEFQFHSAYLNAILDKFAQLSGPDGIAYGRPNVQRVYARSSTANLLRGRVYMTEPYFLIDNVYTGSRERCTNDSDCVRANTASGYESCTNNTCIGYTRPISEVFKLSCFTYGTEALFITKKINNEHVVNQSNTKISGGVVAALVLLTVSLMGTIFLLVFMALKERKGKPLFG